MFKTKLLTIHFEVFIASLWDQGVACTHLLLYLYQHLSFKFANHEGKCLHLYSYTYR